MATIDTTLYPDQEKKEILESQGDTNTAFGDKSPGVRQVEAITQSFTSWHRWVLFVSIFLVAYSYGLDLTCRYFFQTFALQDFGDSAQISTVSVVRSIVAAAAQPAFAKISDYFGRLSILLLAVILYIIGTIVQATSKNLSAFSGGALLYQFGYTGVQLLVEILIADSTSLRNRLFFSFVPSAPYLINTWVSAYITTAIYNNSTWQWGIGMWGIIFPAMCVPLFFSLLSAEWRAKRLGLLNGIPSPYKALGNGAMWTDFFWQIDLVGLLLIAAVFALILLPFTLAGGVSSIWGTARVIAPLVIGFVVALPAFIFWEWKMARHPIIPARILKDRQVVAALVIALLLNAAWYTQGDYLYYTLLVSFDRDLVSAGHVQNIFTFVSTITGITLGLVVRYVRHLKWFIVAGTAIFVIAFGLLIRYRGGTDGAHFAGLVAGEVLLGIGVGLFSYPTQALIQSSVQHERTAVVTSLYLASYSIGSAVGNTIAGAIWTNTLPGKIAAEFQNFGVNNATAVTYAYSSPQFFIADYPTGTPERDALGLAYREVQRYLTITGICISSILFIASLFLRNPTLGDAQSLENAEGFEVPTGHTLTHDQSPTTTANDVENQPEGRKKRFGF